MDEYPRALPVPRRIHFCAGWYGYYVSSRYSAAAAHCLTVAVELWIMPLLFGIAGLSTKFALQERTSRVYLKERVTKLLLPFLAGLVLVCPVIAYYAMKFHAGYTGNFAGAFVHFFSSIQNPQGPIGIAEDFSVEHLWFVLFLFIFSVVALGLILLRRRWAGLRLCPGNAGFPVLVLLFIPVWLLNYAGFNVTGYSLLSYFAIFLTGCCLLSQEPVLARLEKYWAVFLEVWICLTIGVMWIYGIFLGHSEVFWGSSVLFVVMGWTGLLVLLGAGRHLADRTSPLTTYLGTASYPVYIIHQAVMVAVAYYVLMLAIPPALQFQAIAIFSVLLTFACYESLRIIPGVRVLFGIVSP